MPPARPAWPSAWSKQIDTEWQAFLRNSEFLLSSTRIPMRYIFSTGSLHTNSIERFFDFAARAGFDGIEIRVGNRWDTTHFGTWHLEPLDIYVRWQEKVHHLYLSNVNGREHRRPEDGHLRLDLPIARSAADGYGGSSSLELRPNALRSGASHDVIVEVDDQQLGGLSYRGELSGNRPTRDRLPSPCSCALLKR